MYPNLKNEMVKRKMTQNDLAESIGCTRATMSLKLSGKAPITLDEAFSIKKAVKTRMSLDVLFAKEAV